MNTDGWVECTPSDTSFREVSIEFKPKASDKKIIRKIKSQKEGYHGDYFEIDGPNRGVNLSRAYVWKSLVKEVPLPQEGKLRLLLS